MLKLKSITFDQAPSIPGVRAGVGGKIECLNPTEPMRGWRAVIKGAMLVLVSPSGWKSGKQPREWEKDGPVQAWESPRANCHLQWEADASDDVVAMLSKGFISEPFGKPIEAAELEAVEKKYTAPVNPAEIGDL